MKLAIQSFLAVRKNIVNEILKLSIFAVRKLLSPFASKTSLQCNRVEYTYNYVNPYLYTHRQLNC